MAALTADLPYKRRNINGQRTDEPIVATGVQVYQGALVCYDSNQQLILAADLGAAGNFAGIATTNVLGDGVKRCKIETGIEVLLVCESGVTYALLLQTVYCMNTGGVTNASSVGPACGQLKELPTASTAWVLLGECGLPVNT